MANLIVLVVILLCIAYLYFQSTLVKSFAILIFSLCSIVVSFAYFELLANLLIDKITKEEYLPWAHPGCFILLFMIAFGLLRGIYGQLALKPVDLGRLVEAIGRVICGFFLGITLSGVIIIFLIMAPLTIKKPYQRFDPEFPDIETPQKALLNADGFASGWFSLLSKGSFSGTKSFAVLHANYLDQLFLNNQNIDEDIAILAAPDAITVPKKAAAWLASQDLKDQKGNIIAAKSGYDLIIVRIGITKNEVKDGGHFTLSQLRLICKHKDDTENIFAGQGVAAYPIGYLKAANRVEIKSLNSKMRIKRNDLQGKERWIDFAFYVPSDFVPVLAEYKQNSVAKVGSMVDIEKAPAVIPFIQRTVKRSEPKAEE